MKTTSVNQKTVARIAALMKLDNKKGTGPVERVRQVCSIMRRYPRAVVVKTLTEFGVNFHTARTQYQKWFAAHHPKAQ